MATAKGSPPYWHTAKLGLLGEDIDSNMVGITCDHVTLASDGNLFMDIGNGQIIKVGTTDSASRTERRTIDADCFKLTHTFLTYFIGNPTQFERCREYKGTITDLYGKSVFRDLGVDRKDNSAANRKYGRVASSKDHQHCDELSTASNFLVAEETPCCGQFATEGNSGDFVAIEEDGCTCVVGIITSGDYIPTHRKSKSPYTICLFLKSALDVMGAKFKKLFTSCVTLLFKIPEQIEPMSFNLADRLIALTNLDIPTVCEDTVRCHLEYEKSLSAKIDSRTEITSSIFHEDEPLQACIISHVKACGAVYSDNIGEAEAHLKTAARCLDKADPLILLMLSKLLVAAAWYFRIANKPQDAKSVLDEGWEFMEEFRNNSLFPRSSEFYIYFEYSKYYKNESNYAEAARYSKKAIDHSRNPSKASAKNRHMLAVCQYADIKLKCGDNFETKHLDASVSQEDIDDVASYMAEVENICAEADPTARCFYLLRQCDLLYKQHDLAGALDSATTCHELATSHGILKDRYEARARIAALRQWSHNQHVV